MYKALFRLHKYTGPAPFLQENCKGTDNHLIIIIIANKTKETREHRYCFEVLILFLLGIYPEMRLLDHMVVLF